MFPFLHRRYTARLQVPQELHVEHQHRPFAPLLRFFPPLPHQVPAEADRTFSLPRRMDPTAAASSSQSFFRRMRLSSTLQSTTATSHFSFISNSRRWSSSSSSSTASDDTPTTAPESQEQTGEQTTATTTATDTTTQTRKFELLDFIFDQTTTLAQAVSIFTKQDLHEQVQNQLASITVKDLLAGNAANRFDNADVNKIRADDTFKFFYQAFLDSVKTQQQLIQLQVTSWYDLAELIVAADGSLELQAKLEAVKNILGTRIDIVKGFKQFIESLITRESTSKLLTGQTFRHTSTFPFGMRGREQPVDELKEPLARNSSTVATGESPFVFVTSTPGQGTTRFVDEIGYSPELIATLSGTWKCDPNAVFVFNVTFGSNWKIETDKEYSLQEARNEVSLRLIAAAMGIFTAEELKESGHANVVRAFLSWKNPSISKVAFWLQRVLWKVHHPDDKWCEPNKPASSQGTWLYLFNELTELGDRIRKGTDPLQTRETQKIEFYSSLANIIGSRCAVIGSGFTEIVLHGPLDVSMRPVRPCTILPVVTSVQRRELLVMKTLYFQLMSMYSPSEAVLFYELTKSSPGVLGSILELLSDTESSTSDISHTLLELLATKQAIPYLRTVSDRQNAMRNVMAWKSIQFCSVLSDSDEDPLGKLGKAMRIDCEEAEMQKTVSRDAASIIWLGESICSVSSRRRRRHTSYLSDVLVEPLFYMWSTLRNEDKTALSGSSSDFFTLFAHMLKEYSKCCSMIGTNQASSTHVNDCVLRHFVPSTQATNCPPEFSSTNDKIVTTTLSTLNGCFFEDAVAVGICAQKQLRLSLKERNKISSNKVVSGITSSLGAFFFRGSRHEEGKQSPPSNFLSPIIKTRNSQDPDHVIVVEWISADEQQIPVSLVHFFGDYPGRRETQGEYDGAVVWADNETQVGETKSIADCFNTHTVLRPARPESNPLVDIIFHEKVASSNNELIQFWVDTKHSHETIEPFGQEFESFKKRVQTALNNPILTSETSKIKHVVHIIVSTFEPNAATRQALEKVGISLPQPGTTNQWWPPNFFRSTPSYTLYIVDPDSLCFEHLVSHVIARSIPLTEQQRAASWSRSLGFADEWRTFKAMSTDGTQLDASGSTNDLLRQFVKWEQLRLDDDSVALVQGTARLSNSSTATTDADEKSVIISNLPPASDSRFVVSDGYLKRKLFSFLANHRVTQAATITIKTNLDSSRYAVVSGFDSAESAILCAQICNGQWIALRGHNSNNNVAFLLQATQQHRLTTLQQGPKIRFQFGAALEAFGIVAPSPYKSSYNRRDARTSGPILELTTDKEGSRFLSGKVLAANVNFDDQYTFLTMLYRSVRIGHLLQHDNTSQYFFQCVFLWLRESAWQDSAFRRNLIAFAKKGVTNGEQLQIDEFRACALFVCSLWNLSVADWERWQCLSEASGYKMSHRRFLSDDLVNQIDERTWKVSDFLFSGKGITVF